MRFFSYQEYQYNIPDSLMDVIRFLGSRYFTVSKAQHPVYMTIGTEEYRPVVINAGEAPEGTDVYDFKFDNASD